MSQGIGLETTEVKAFVETQEVSHKQGSSLQMCCTGFGQVQRGQMYSPICKMLDNSCNFEMNQLANTLVSIVKRQGTADCLYILVVNFSTIISNQIFGKGEIHCLRLI